MMIEVKHIFVEVKKPSGSFPGRIHEGHYIIKDGWVALSDVDGKPIDGYYKHKLRDGENPGSMARVLLRERHRGDRGSGPIRYPPMKLA